MPAFAKAAQQATGARQTAAGHGEKYYPRKDEDGILLEICRRIQLTKGRFLEFGVGNGLENNSLILLMSGWRGAWLGNDSLAFNVPAHSKRLVFSQAWVSVENALQLYADSARLVGVLDLDGNDLHILRELLRHFVRPSVVIVEYSRKFRRQSGLA